MKPSEIIEAAKQWDDADITKLLWFLQSLSLEDGGAKRFRASAEEFVSPEVRTISTKQGWVHEDLDHALSRLALPYSTKKEQRRFYFDYQRHYETEAIKNFYQTNVGRMVWDTLDWCLEERRPCLIQGREGRGKSASAKAWHDAHRGQSLYVSLPAFGNRRDFFEALARATGVSYSRAKEPNGLIKWHITDAIVKSGLVLVIDEAHFALPEIHTNKRPALIDFIDADLCNAGVPVALITTPQFGAHLSEFEARSKWNAGQFRRRFSGRWIPLPESTDADDLYALAERFLPNVGKAGVELAANYAASFDRDVSGMFDLIRDAQRRARKAGRAEVTARDLSEAYSLDRLPSENAMAESFKRPDRGVPGFTAAPVEEPARSDTTAAPLQPPRRAAITELPSRRSVKPAETVAV